MECVLQWPNQGAIFMRLHVIRKEIYPRIHKRSPCSTHRPSAVPFTKLRNRRENNENWIRPFAPCWPGSSEAARGVLCPYPAPKRLGLLRIEPWLSMMNMALESLLHFTVCISNFTTSCCLTRQNLMQVENLTTFEDARKGWQGREESIVQ